MNPNTEEIQKFVTKTGTTILGLICKDGAVMAADRRVTAGGGLVVKKDFQKVLIINDYILMSISGNLSDANMLAKFASAELKLMELKTKNRPLVKEAANLIAMMSYKNIRTPSMIPSIVGSIVGGFDEDGSVEIYTIEPAGGVDKINDYDANFSSGMPFVLGLLERQWKKDLTLQQGVDLAVEALKSSTQRDTASGNGIDVFTISKDGINHVVSQEIISVFK